MTETAPAEYDNFYGGFTDFHLNGPAHQCRRAENFVLLEYGKKGKLLSRPGSALYDAANPQVPAGNQRVGTLRFFEGTLFSQSARDVYYISAGSFQTLSGPSGNKVFPAGVTVDSVVSVAEWNHHLFLATDSYTKPAKLYKDSGGTFRIRTAGMPALASSPTLTPTAGALTYTYRFLYKYTYTVGNRTFVDRGSTTEVQTTTSATIGGGSPNAISTIPVLANGATDNYDTTVVKVEIYRTIAGGTDFYYVSEVTNGTTTYNDTTTDATLLTNEPLYTAGGVVENDPPPLCKLLHVTEDVGFYADIKEGSEVFKNRLRQSLAGDIDSSPEDFFAEVDADIVGLSSVRGVPILLCSRGVFRVDGRFDEQGRGGLFPQKISDTATCVSAQSVVQTLEGVFWWGHDAIYFTDGTKVIKINEHWPETHKTYLGTVAKERRIQGAYDPDHLRIWWSVQAGDTDCDTCIILDLNWGISEQSSFTKAVDNGSLSWAPAAITFSLGDLHRGDTRGYLLKHADTATTDPMIDTAVAAADWETETIIYYFESCAYNFGSNFQRHYIPRISVQAQNKSNLSLQIYSINDDGKSFAALKPIRFRGNITWGDPNVIWGDPSLVWRFFGVIEEWRRFPAKTLRCSYKAIALTNAMVVIVNSDLIDTAEVDGGTKLATLTDAATYDWPTDLLEYYIAFSQDWEREFRIIDRTANTIEVDDSDGTALQSQVAAEWEIRGKPKSEIFLLISYTLHFAQYGMTQTTFQNASSGSIAP